MINILETYNKLEIPLEEQMLANVWFIVFQLPQHSKKI